MPVWAYPPYAYSVRCRQLAEEKDEQIVNEHGELLPSASWEELRGVILGYDLIVDNLLHWRYLPDAIADLKHAIVCCAWDGHNPIIVRVDVRVGNKRGTIVSRAAWPPGFTLEDHRALCDHFGVGTYPTPASLGDGLMRQSLDQNRLAAAARLRKLPVLCQADVESALVGLRTETLAPKGFYLPEATELDRKAAYVTECLEPMPCGYVRVLLDEEYVDPSEWYLARCTVTVLSDLPLGPFPVRDDVGELAWPTKRGIYQEVWLTKGEVEDTRAAGCLVQIISGWVWERMAPVLKPWAEQVLAARDSAPTKAQEKAVKLVGNAAIGRLAMRGSSRRVVPATTDGQPLIDNGTISQYVTVPLDRQTVTLPHLALFIWSEARRHLYARQLAELKDGNPAIVTNTDSLILPFPSRLPMDGWRSVSLKDLVIVTERSYTARGVTILPGQTEKVRETAIAYCQRIVEEKEAMRLLEPQRYYETYILPMRRRNGTL